MIIKACCLLTIGLMLCCKPSHDPRQEEWIQLFNEKDLTGWDIKIAGYDLNDNLNNTFKVKDKVLQVDYSESKHFTKEFGHLYYHEPFSYYRVRLEYRFVGKQLEGGPDYAYLNSGIMVHSQAANTLDKGQTFPVSLEMQFLADDGKTDRHTGNLCTPGTEASIKGKPIESHCVNSDSKIYPSGQWVAAEAVVLGDSVIHHIIEEDTVLTYEQPRTSSNFVSQRTNWTFGGFSDSVRWIQQQGTLLKEGYIALQAESHPVEFRKIELLNLKGCTDPKAINYKSYFVRSDNSQCRYK